MSRFPKDGRVKAVLVNTHKFKAMRLAAKAAQYTEDLEKEASETPVQEISDNCSNTTLMAQESFMHLLQQDHKAKNLSRFLDELSLDYKKCFMEGRSYAPAAIMKLYELSFGLRAGGDSWLDFCRRPEWANARPKPKLKDADQALRHVLKFVCGIKAGAGSNILSTLTTALKPFWDRGASSQEASAAINGGGGIAIMARIARSEARKEKNVSRGEFKILSDDLENRSVLENANDGQEFSVRLVKRGSGKTSRYELLRVKMRGKRTSR